jgi:uncharacterized protein (TIGR03067 family)
MRALVLFSLLALAAPNREDPTPKDKRASPADLVLGDWALEKLEHGSPRQPHDTIQRNLAMRITATDSFFMSNGTVSEGDGLTARIAIDWSKNPAAIDFMPKSRGGKMPGILKIEGDVLILGLTTGGDQRPTDFATAQMLGHYRRIKK